MATEEVNDVSILSGKHGSSRRWGSFYGQSSSIGSKSFSQKNGAEEIVLNLNNEGENENVDEQG